MKRHYYLLAFLMLIIIIIFIESCSRKASTPFARPSPGAIQARYYSTHCPNSITRNILQDKKGNYWFATWEGIICYDGGLFTNVMLKEGLNPVHVFAFLEDKAGNVWFGTDSGVSCYNGKVFYNFTTADGLCGRSVNAMMQDRAGKLWFGTRYGDSNDVCCYDGKQFTAFKNKNEIRFTNVRSIIEDKTGNTWFGGEDGLVRYDGGSFSTLSKKFTAYIFEDRAGNIWTNEADVNGAALRKYNGHSSSCITVSRMMFGITEDRAGNTWFGTMNGVCRYDGKMLVDFR